MTPTHHCQECQFLARFNLSQEKLEQILEAHNSKNTPSVQFHSIRHYDLNIHTAPEETITDIPLSPNIFSLLDELEDSHPPIETETQELPPVTNPTQIGNPTGPPPQEPTISTKKQIYHTSQQGGPSKQPTITDLLKDIHVDTIEIPSSPEDYIETPRGKGDKGKGKMAADPQKTVPTKNKKTLKIQIDDPTCTNKNSKAIEQDHNHQDKLEPTKTKQETHNTNTVGKKLEKKQAHIKPHQNSNPFHPYEQTIYISCREKKFYHEHEDIIHRALTKAHTGRYKLIITYNGQLIVHCSSVAQTTKFLEIEHMGRYKVNIQKHKRAHKTPQQHTLDKSQPTHNNNNTPTNKNKFKTVLHLGNHQKNMTDEQLTTRVKDSGIPIIKAYRIITSTGYPTQKAVLETTSSLPPIIKLAPHNINYKTEPYINKPRFCSNCSHWGHYTTKCKYSTICPQCANPHSGRCKQSNTTCTNCKGSHHPKSPTCPYTIREEETMALMNSTNVPYHIAKSSIIEKSKKERKQIQNTPKELPQEERIDPQTYELIKNMKDEIIHKISQIADLMAEIISQRSS